MRGFIPSLFAVSALASPVSLTSRAAKGIYFLLAGDSTTAPNGGWGDAFLSTTVASGSSGHNYGHGGATTASFRSGGDWAKVTNDIGTYKSTYDVYVTIQFGHNDQKANSGVTVEQFKANLLKFAQETTSAGGAPILLTPLTRRNFASSTSNVTENLVEQRSATIDVATNNNIKWIDLNLVSMNYVNTIKKDAASKYNLAANDWTHLNTWGGVVFSRIVSDLLVEKYGNIFTPATKANSTLSALIKAGKPA
ncbi:esterase [Massarina eburnea CBS 473.64]|uniref:Esterase n=1 Tax=Massarina eburnea CBS 473.64 TaxID=1395130 RepID=A0A6A6SG34_9PLEO|nr:esterase [Massarina eburnea CBS 473.64]